MAHIETSIEIAAGQETVWAAISDLATVSRWNPNVSSAQCGGPGGVGTTRTCHLSAGGHIDEVVFEWSEGRRIQFAIGSHGAIRSADMGMVLTATGEGTRVTATADYHPAFGPLGPVMDRIAMKRQMTRMLRESLTGLKEHVEATQTKGTT